MKYLLICNFIFYDIEHELENYFCHSYLMDVNILEKLMKILEVNPYVNFFKTLNDTQFRRIFLSALNQTQV